MGALEVVMETLVSSASYDMADAHTFTHMHTPYFSGDKKKRAARHFADADVVITTYGTLTSESGEGNGNARNSRTSLGPLFKTKWWRVMLGRFIHCT